MKVTIPKQQISHAKHTAGQCQCGRSHTRDFEITAFSCTGEDGTLYAPCQAFGNRKAQLEEAMAAGHPVEVESIERNAQFNIYSVRFPRASASEAAFRQRASSSGGAWSAGYRGKPLSEKRFHEMTEGNLRRYYGVIDAIRKKAGVDMTPEVFIAIIDQARSLNAQYWMETEKNLSYPEGCEPFATHATTGSAQEPQPVPAPADGAPPAVPPSPPGGAPALHERIEAAENSEELDAVRDAILKSDIPDQEKSSLFMALYQKKMSLGGN